MFLIIKVALRPETRLHAINKLGLCRLLPRIERWKTVSIREPYQSTDNTRMAFLAMNVRWQA